MFNTSGKIVTTPNILTEVTYFGGELKEPDLSRFFNSFPELMTILKVEENYVSSNELARLPKLKEFGLTDLSIEYTAIDKYLVLTDDSKLSSYLSRNGIDVIDFLNFRKILGRY